MDECNICFTEKEIFIILPCKHELCDGCFKSWVMRNHNCPFCRKEIHGFNSYVRNLKNDIRLNLENSSVIDRDIESNNEENNDLNSNNIEDDEISDLDMLDIISINNERNNRAFNYENQVVVNNQVVIQPNEQRYSELRDIIEMLFFTICCIFLFFCIVGIFMCSSRKWSCNT